MSSPGPPAAARHGIRRSAGVDVAPTGLGFLLGVAHRARRRAWEAELADLAITAPQAALLRLVAAQPGQGVRRLARQLGTDPMNVQRVAESLIGAGLCEGRRDPGDARRRPLYPTDKGNHLASTVADRVESAELELVDALGDGCYHALLEGLRALIDHDRGVLGPTTSAKGTRGSAARAHSGQPVEGGA